MAKLQDRIIQAEEDKNATPMRWRITILDGK
jgi:hypothetical protein